jgi:hypothetical protein
VASRITATTGANENAVGEVIGALPDFNTSELRPFLEAGEQLRVSPLLAGTPHFLTAPARDSGQGRNAEKNFAAFDPESLWLPVLLPSDGGHLCPQPSSLGSHPAGSYRDIFESGPLRYAFATGWLGRADSNLHIRIDRLLGRSHRGSDFLRSMTR